MFKQFIISICSGETTRKCIFNMSKYVFVIHNSVFAVAGQQASVWSELQQQGRRRRLRQRHDQGLGGKSHE